MPEYKRFCYETCAKDEAFADDLGGMKRYWVRLDGECVRYFEREHWPAYVEFVRPMEPSRNPEKERRELANLIHAVAEELDQACCLAAADCFLAAGYRKVARWEVPNESGGGA